MGIIKRKEKVETQWLRVKIPSELVDRLVTYAAHLETPVASIVEQAVAYAISKDKEFAASYGARPKRARKAAGAAE